VKLAVSNIAWDRAEDDAVADVLREENVSGVEIAPTAWRPEPYTAPRQEMIALRRQWEDRGIEIVSLQSLLFGRSDLLLFDKTTRGALRDYLMRAIDFANAVGARALVFGSPKNRRRESMPPDKAIEEARDFFASLAPYAHEHETALCLEANPAEYGGDFLLATPEAVALCELVDHPGVRVNGDLGGMIIAGEDVSSTLASSAPVLGHVHASEPYLVELQSTKEHELAGRALARAGYSSWVSIEMRKASEGTNVDAVRRAVRLAKRAYAAWSS
jgi:sugar phosphate isomerase/epimerase